MNIKRKYEIERIDTKRETVEMVYNTKAKKMEARKRTIDGGFMVYFPQGHSTFFEDEATMRAMGITEVGALVDMDTGMPVSAEMLSMFDNSLKNLVERNTQITPPSQRGAPRGGVAQSIADGE